MSVLRDRKILKKITVVVAIIMILALIIFTIVPLFY